MPQPNALASLQEVKAHLRVSVDDDNELIERLTDAASDRIEQYCQTAFIKRAFTEYHEGGRKRIYLQRYPVVSVASVTDPAGNTVPATDYIVKMDRGILEHFGHFWVAQTTGGQPTQWTIVYTAGRFADSTEVTEDIKLACAKLAGSMLDRPSAGVSSVSVGGLSVSYIGGESPEIPPDVADLLGTYKCNTVL